jgi:2-haloacid dehalogenase
VIEAVVFDIGGVLLDWDPRHLYRTVFDDDEAMERFLADVCSPAWHAPHDRGASTAASCAALAALHPDQADEIWAWLYRGEEMVAGELAGTVAVLHELTSAGVACYALSNMEAETFPLRAARFDFFGQFTGVVISGQEKVAKPDREIFVLLLDRFGLDPATTLFIDDSIDNLRPAAELGMATVHFRSPQALRQALGSAGLLTAGS